MLTRRQGDSVIFMVLVAAALQAPALAQVGGEPGRQEQVLFNGQVQVPPGSQWNYSFSTRTNFINGRIAGNVQAAGGSGNDIRVLVARGPSVIYDSGRRRSVVLSVDISEPGQYALIFDNGFSLVSPKAVGGRISLVHWGVDTEKNATDRQAAANRYGQAMRILQRLYATLKSNERVWGTTQLFALPTLRLKDDSAINAAASWSANFIQVNRGMFEFAESAGDKGDDVLAAILAHELGHIFYRHPGYGSGDGLKGFIDELRGVTELDRVQEKEADLLGLRIACQARFDPEGMLLAMRKFAELDGSASSFMRNHPSGVERFNYLQGEASRCQSLQSQQRPTPAPSQAVTINSAAAERTDAQGLWKLVQSPNVPWKFKIGEQFLYGEQTMLEEQRKMGDYNTVDVKKQGDGYIGTQRVRVTFKVGDATRQGFHHQTCQWDFVVELTSVTEERIEGRWEGYPKDSRLSPGTCAHSGQRIWEDATWIKY